MNIFLYEFKTSIKKVLIWSFSIWGFSLLFLLIYPIFNDEVTKDQMLLFIQTYPEDVLDAIGFNMDVFFTFHGYFSFLIVYVLLIAGIQSMIISLSSFNKEKSLHITDFILTKPISRNYFYLNKVLSCFTQIGLTNVILMITIIPTCLFFDKNFLFDKVFLMCLDVFLVQLMFMGLGILIGIVVVKIKSINGVAALIGVGLYVFNMISAIDKSDTLKKLSPYGLFSPNDILDYNGILPINLLIGLVFTIICLTISYFIFIKQEFKA